MKKHEIDDNHVIDYYGPRVYQTLVYIKKGFDALKEEEKELETLAHTYDDPRINEFMALWKGKLKDKNILDTNR